MKLATASRRRALSRRSWLVGVATIVLAMVSVRGMSADAGPATVRLVVDYGDNVQVHFTAIPWREEMTALDALTAAQKHSHGITFSHRGSGSSAMVTQIGNLKNEANGKSWIFHVNDKAGEVSAGASPLRPRDVVLWRFQTYDYNR